MPLVFSALARTLHYTSVYIYIHIYKGRTSPSDVLPLSGARFVVYLSLTGAKVLLFPLPLPLLLSMQVYGHAYVDVAADGCVWGVNSYQGDRCAYRSCTCIVRVMFVKQMFTNSHGSLEQCTSQPA